MAGLAPLLLLAGALLLPCALMLTTAEFHAHSDLFSAEHHPPADGPGVAHEFLEAHNRVRAKYGVPTLRWSSKLARYARRWSSLRRFDCVPMHSPNSPYGENVFWGTGREWRAADAVTSWATEASYFDWRSQACHPGQVCGHFTQLVWNDTELVGCGRAECFGGGVFITCSYDPPGNWKGEVPLT
ncbi:pathogenesis-related protein PRB1-3-like [Phragmites australis]|uniref:pathogenesis-related protein PRB1-3-like n=1 Tax=Phragmites australis TaxID=29695 RepID=UPI002D773EF1|nr:pathogenesis-related protein PRB1-3-like [Phragmites australis]